MRTLEEIFHDRSCHVFSSKKIDKKIIYQIYELMKLGPTSANTMPLRILLVETTTSKEQLLEMVDRGNREAVKSAPVIALFAYDNKFYDKMDILFPHSNTLKNIFAQNTNLSKETAFRNSVLQAAYFLILARGFNISCGPMSGFNKAKIDEAFFADTEWEVNFICNLGYASNSSTTNKRLPRLSYDEVVRYI